eukprot:CFRG2241T1
MVIQGIRMGIRQVLITVIALLLFSSRAIADTKPFKPKKDQFKNSVDNYEVIETHADTESPPVFMDWEGCSRNGTCTKPDVLGTNDVQCFVVSPCKPCVSLDLKTDIACELTGFRHTINCNQTTTTDPPPTLPTEESCTIISIYSSNSVIRFEGITLGILVLSGAVLWRRQRYLANVMYARLLKRTG